MPYQWVAYWEDTAHPVRVGGIQMGVGAGTTVDGRDAGDGRVTRPTQLPPTGAAAAAADGGAAAGPASTTTTTTTTTGAPVARLTDEQSDRIILDGAAQDFFRARFFPRTLQDVRMLDNMRQQIEAESAAVFALLRTAAGRQEFEKQQQALVEANDLGALVADSRIIKRTVGNMVIADAVLRRYGAEGVAMADENQRLIEEWHAEPFVNPADRKAWIDAVTDRRDEVAAFINAKNDEEAAREQQQQQQNQDTQAAVEELQGTVEELAEVVHDLPPIDYEDFGEFDAPGTPQHTMMGFETPPNTPQRRALPSAEDLMATPRKRPASPSYYPAGTGSPDQAPPPVNPDIINATTDHPPVQQRIPIVRPAQPSIGERLRASTKAKTLNTKSWSKYLKKSAKKK